MPLILDLTLLTIKLKFIYVINLHSSEFKSLEKERKSP